MKEILQNESVISGRNAVKELLSSGRDIDKIYVQKGEREGSVKMLIGKASERKIPIIEADKSKLDAMCGGAFHQGAVPEHDRADPSLLPFGGKRQSRH